MFNNKTRLKWACSHLNQQQLGIKLVYWTTINELNKNIFLQQKSRLDKQFPGLSILLILCKNAKKWNFSSLFYINTKNISDKLILDTILWISDKFLTKFLDTYWSK